MTRSLLACTLLLAALSGSMARAEEARGLRRKDFPSARALTHRQIQAINVGQSSGTLKPAVFDRKWKSSLETPGMFMRSYPGAYWSDLRQLGPDRIPGGMVTGLGDAHPQNFGFIRINGRTRFVFNDLDDSGKVPVALDAARYFSTLRLMVDDKALARRVLEQYVATIKDPRAARPIDASFRPNWTKVDRNDLARYTVGGQKLDSSDPAVPLSPVGPAVRRAVERTLAGARSRLGAVQVLDVASRAREYGGSGGLIRYWALVKQGGRTTILELKQAGAPSSEQLGLKQRLDPDRRLGTLERAFWGAVPGDDLFYVKLQGKRFLVRDRLEMENLDILKLDPRQREEVLLAQASIMADLHRTAWKGVSRDEIERWLWKSSKTLARRWDAAYHEGLAAGR
jgi:hypothetical protein